MLTSLMVVITCHILHLKLTQLLFSYEVMSDSVRPEELMLFNCGTGKDSCKSPGQQGFQTSQSSRKSVLNIHWRHWHWSWSSNTLATWYEEWTHWKRLWCWERLRAGEDGATEYEMAGWHHWLNRREFEETPGDGEGQGSLACYSPWGSQKADMT